MIRLSLCMIVKNEEAVLTRVLASAIQFADEILVADTGSTDRTVEIARQYTKHIYHYPWNDDFAARAISSVKRSQPNTGCGSTPTMSFPQNRSQRF